MPNSSHQQRKTTMTCAFLDLSVYFIFSSAAWQAWCNGKVTFQQFLWLCTAPGCKWHLRVLINLKHSLGHVDCRDDKRLLHHLQGCKSCSKCCLSPEAEMGGPNDPNLSHHFASSKSFERSCCHCSLTSLAMRCKALVAPWANFPLREPTKGTKIRHCSRHCVSHFCFSSFSATMRHFFGSQLTWEGASRCWIWM